ncbi:hypothetical protein OXX80_013901, partial [Metschnikowia pulcherrima]
MPGVTV